MAWLTILSTAGILLCTSLGYLVHTFYDHRRKINELRRRGVPMPKEWSWVTGHLLVLQKYVNRIPPDAAVAFAMRDLAEEYADTEVFLMDVWPVYPALFTLFGPETITEVCNKYNLPKPPVSASSMEPVAGGPNLISMNGDEWKYWRSLFNPGFSSGAMLNNVPHIVDSALVFREKLIENIGKGMFPLDELTTKLAMEVILKVTLDDDSNYQRSPHVLPTALGRILRWHSFWDPRVLLNPLRPFVQRYNGYIIKNYIRKELQKRFYAINAERNLDTLHRKPTGIKSVTTLALEAYLEEEQTKEGAPKKDVLDERFVTYATSQIRLFLFAGTDTSSSMLVYIYHMLAKHPDWLGKIRNEHDEIFGRDPANAAGLLKDTPGRLNNCKLTLAFIKETLRLYAPAGTTRAGIPGMTVTDLQGNEQPMQHAGANVLHQALHVNPRVWPRPKEFLPERFLVAPGHELYPDPTAFRPFEQGPRNCIGQTLVWNELRVVVILTCRDLEIRDAYDDFDAIKQNQMGTWSRWKTSLFGEPIKTVHGDRAYQTDSGGLHPVDGYPCYVKWTNDG
ncbi:putative cytochrome P450 [Xylaria cf. heliscus]|nr:putative cytochrome P450 [Xylaria cf. heliscus]